MLGGGGLWELVEQRADETPDARLLVDALPRNPSGKVVKVVALRERYGAR